MDLGQLIQIIFLIAGAFGVFIKLRDMVTDLHKQNLEALAEMREEMARQSARLETLYDWWKAYMEGR